MSTAEALRDEGMQAAEAAADPRVIIIIDAKIAEANASGMPWSANDIRASLPVVSPGLVGGRVRAAAMRRPREMRKVNMTRSDLPSTRHAWIAVWQGVEQMSAPSPRCGRLDDHPPHEWDNRASTYPGWVLVHHCPGHVTTEGGQPCVECARPVAACRCEIERAEARDAEWWA